MSCALLGTSSTTTGLISAEKAHSEAAANMLHMLHLTELHEQLCEATVFLQVQVRV